ncbi:MULTISPECIES: hypothetical protein [unclassified Roseateles]|uniref:hypothetical protein n=1 Tax=unclassified Roseateles TaxID=2626991 RepID=UPI0007145562|nr:MULTISPECIES: hypothetical protein [unclassified Roseateles]KQW45538.1 hypothetical protein ASC81_11575 [Pelomonas sp. Root405]
MSIARSRFYSVFALAVALLTLVGFFRTFYARPLFSLPPLPSMLTLHSVVFTAWVIVFFVQVRLIAARQVKAHMALGLAGTALAVLVVVVGLVPAIDVALSNRRSPMGLTSQQFFIVPIFSIGTFAIFFALGVALRRNAAYHKRLMMLAMVAVLGPAVFRVLKLLNGAGYFLVVETAIAAALVLWCIAHDWRKHHCVHPVYAVGGSLLVLSWPLRMAIAPTQVWTNMAARLLT